MSDCIYDIQLLAAEESAPEAAPLPDSGVPAELSPEERAPAELSPEEDLPAADEELSADFEALIRGRYKAAFDARVRKILDGRLRGLRRENESLRRSADAGVTAAAAHLERLERQSDQIRAVYPAFRWEAELENPAFARLIGAGVDGRTAYEVIHREELLRHAMAYAARRAVTQTARSIASGARPAAENGGRSPSVSRTDPRQLTGADLADIRRRVKNGEKIRF